MVERGNVNHAADRASFLIPRGMQTKGCKILIKRIEENNDIFDFIIIRA